jgi:hypothetical protein
MGIKLAEDTAGSSTRVKFVRMCGNQAAESVQTATSLIVRIWHDQLSTSDFVFMQDGNEHTDNCVSQIGRVLSSFLREVAKQDFPEDMLYRQLDYDVDAVDTPFSPISANERYEEMSDEKQDQLLDQIGGWVHDMCNIMDEGKYTQHDSNTDLIFVVREESV